VPLFLYILSGVGFSFWLVGCTPSPSGELPFVVAIDSAPTQLDPRFATDAYSERIGQLLYSRLLRSDPTGQTIPDLAERWEIEDAIRYTFYIKKNVRFHDGQPLTAEDVRYTYESMLDPALGSPHRKSYEIIDRIETPDLYTIRFILRKPYAPFLTEMRRGIVPKQIAEKGLSSGPLVGSGPFTLVRNHSDDAVELSAYRDYFDGAPPTRRLLFRVIPEDSVRLLEMEKGNIDLIQNAFPPDALPRLQANPRLKIVQSPGSTYSYLGFNLKDPVLRDRRVREAIALSINREEITEYIFKKLAHPATGLLPASHWAYSPSASAYPYQPEQAKRLLDEAGYPDPEGSAPRFNLIHKTSQNELARRVAEVLQRQMALVGIAVEIRSYEWGTFYADIKSGNFQLFTLSWVGIQDPDIYHNVFHSGSIPPNGSNRGFYQNAAVDRLVEEARVELNGEKRKALYAEVQEIVSRDLPYVSLWHTDNVAVMKKEVEGYTLYPDGDFYSLKEVRKTK
jgi:peptide/nickel transport system substrate-binding protein